MINEEILDHLKNNTDMLDNEHIGYFPNDFPFTTKEYHQFYYYLFDKYFVSNADNCTRTFPEDRMYFEHDGFKFIWRMMSGQGTACQLLKAGEPYPTNWNMIFKEDMKVQL